MPVDAQAAKTILDEFSASEGVGKSFSLAIADGKGNIVAEHDAMIPRQPASTLKTLTAFAAATTLDMGSTLDTKTYLIQGDDNRKTVVLQGEGDMLLSDGESDPSHINGHAGLGTLAQRTAEALKQRGITQVDLLYDDSLFGQDRTPAGVTENNAEHRYYTAISTMAVDGGRTWTDMVKPANPGAAPAACAGRGDDLREAARRQRHHRDVRADRGRGAKRHFSAGLGQLGAA